MNGNSMENRNIKLVIRMKDGADIIGKTEMTKGNSQHEN